ncbi:MAG: hypothetical protein IKK38_02885 [Spirochaetaceae bacterium]|nr:hypothetical protein [Spirochaetaceae bacterium]
MKTFKIAAIVPHGNIQSKLQQEQYDFCRKACIIKAAPFLCVLEKLEEGCKNNQVLDKYSELFRSLKKAPEFSALKIAHFRAFRNLNNEISLNLSEESFKVGSFLYRPGELLYGSAEIMAESHKASGNTESKTTGGAPTAAQPKTELLNQLEAALPEQNSPIPLKVFQVAVFSINTSGNLIRWQAEDAKWVRLQF